MITTILHSGSASRMTQCINPIFFVPILNFAQHVPCVSKRITIVLLRQLHDNLHLVGQPIDMSFGSGATLYRTVEFPLVFRAHGHPQLIY